MALGVNRKQVVVPGRAPFDLLGYNGYKAWDDAEDRHDNRDDDVLAQLVKHLRSCSPAAFAETVDAAATDYVGPALWTRILRVGAERVSSVSEILWPFASNITVLAHRNIIHAAVQFLATVYPSRSIEDRVAFEAQVLRSDLFDGEAEKHRWRDVLCQFLSLVDIKAIAADPMHALLEEFEAADELDVSPSGRSLSLHLESSRLGPRSWLADEGVDVEEGIDALLLSRSEAL